MAEGLLVKKNSKVNAGGALVEAVEPRLLFSTIYVDASSLGPTRDGTTWASAFADLQQALAAAVQGDRINVADGTYKPTTTSNRTISFNLKSGVGIYGGYAGYGEANPDDRNVVGYSTILSGEIGSSAVTTDNSQHVVAAESVGRDTVLDGVSVISGYAATASLGAGLYLYNAYPTINNCVFRANQAGGAVEIVASPLARSGPNESPIISNCRFEGNSSASGGAITIEYSSPFIFNCVFTLNTAVSLGGAIRAISSKPAISNCTFVGNQLTSLSGSGRGGAIYCSAASATINNSIFWDNSSPNPAYHNIYYDNRESATVSLMYCDIEGGYTGVGNIDFEPHFVRLPCRGPDAIYGTSDDDFGDLHLLASSLLVDAGANGGVGTGVLTDLDGNPRIVDVLTSLDAGSGTAPLVDLGAYEVQSAFLAAINGPYTKAQGQSLSLFGSGSSDIAGALNFAWEWSGDGQFDESNVPEPEFPTSNAGVTTLQLRITDAAGRKTYATSSVTVLPSVVYVDDNASGSNSGLNWIDAKADLATALLHAIPGQTVKVAQGIYKPTSGSDRSVSFELGEGITLSGGFAGWEENNPDANDVTQFKTVLSGEIGSPTSLNDNSQAVVNVYGIESGRIDGITITAGSRGMIIQSSTVELVNCAFVGNRSTALGALGAGFYSDAFASTSVYNCRFLGNYAGGLVSSGGGASVGGAATFKNCIFVGNGAQINGGGLEISTGPSQVTVANCTFAKNFAKLGGGLHVSASRPILSNSVFWGNTSTTDGKQVGTSGVSIFANNCDIQGGQNGTATINADPLFVRTPSPGIDNAWGTADDDYGDLRLQPASPCIGTGSNSLVPVGTATDLDANPRIVGNTVDIGAYEYGIDAVLDGTSADDVFSIGLSADGASLQVNNGIAPATGNSTSYPLFTLRSLLVRGLSGDDLVSLDVAGLTSSPSLVFDGGDGNDATWSMGTDVDDQIIVSAELLKIGKMALISRNSEKTEIDSRLGNDRLTLESGHVIIAAGTTIGSTIHRFSQVDILNSAILEFEHTNTIGSRTQHVIGLLNFADEARIELNNNELDLEYSGTSILPAVTTWIRSGISGAHGITSAAVNASLLPGAFLGTIDQAPGTMASLSGALGVVRVKYTWRGDCNLDGVVDGTDYALVDSGFGGSPNSGVWGLGDLNYDDAIDGTDYSLIDTGFASQFQVL